MRSEWIDDVIRQLWQWWSRVIRDLQPVPVSVRHDLREPQTLRSFGSWRAENGENGIRYQLLGRSSRLWKCGCLVMAIGLFPAAAAQASNGTAKLDEKVTTNQVTGTISTINRQAISIEYSKTKQDSYEMLLPIDKETRLQRIRSLAELKPGDTVTVQYQQVVKPDKDGKKIVLKTTATQISLVRSAPEQSLSSREEAAE